MAQVSAIESQKSNIRRSDKIEKRFNIFIGEKFVFAVGEENLLKFKLKVGSLIDDQILAEILKKEDEKKLTDQAINFLSFRPRSQKETEDYLIKKISQKEKLKYHQAKEAPQIPIIIAKLAKYGYLDDLNFAKWWVESRNRARQKGKRLISMELKYKGIDEEIISSVLEDSEGELELALKVLEKKKNKLAKLSAIEAKQKTYYYLGTRGFDTTIIKEAFAIFFKKS